MDTALLYGEPITDDEFLCDKHGCRLGVKSGKMFCPDCYEEEVDAQKEEWEAFLREEDHEEADDGGRCLFIRGKGYNAFQCTMPWWA